MRQDHPFSGCPLPARRDRKEGISKDKAPGREYDAIVDHVKPVGAAPEGCLAFPTMPDFGKLCEMVKDVPESGGGPKRDKPAWCCRRWPT
ncbi:hypothetical protein [Streptomyces sp. NPDC058157]|uniref:hypothetical protein n=1 Tax=Streptomyces sp. NPDC058157 TaxID=3346360 RepID=UPI0036E14410